MADSTLQSGCVPANPEVCDPAASTTRRAVMTAMAGAAMIAGFNTAPATAAQTGTWSNAVARYLRARSAFDAACSARSDADEVYFDRRPQRPTFTMEVEGDYGRFGKHVLPITIRHDDLDDPTKQWADPQRIEQMRLELRAYRDAEADLHDELGLDTLQTTINAASDQHSQALDALLATPVPDLRALTEKLNIAAREYGDDDGLIAAVVADVRRLSREG